MAALTANNQHRVEWAGGHGGMNVIRCGEKFPLRSLWPIDDAKKVKEKKMISILHNLFQKIETEGVVPNLVYETRITLIPKLDKDNTRKKNYRSILLLNID